MDIQQIKYFLALAQELHFWNTAIKMHITQSALSRHIQSMENELGIQLFERNKRNVKLTAAGKFLRDKWEVEISELHFIHQFAKQIHLGEIGTIRIAHPDSISGSILPDLLDKITKTYPKLQIELVQLTYENLDDFLVNYKIDIALTRDINKAKEISSQKIYSDNLCLVVPQEHAFFILGDITKETLAAQKFILTNKDENSSYNGIIDQWFDNYGVVPQVYLHCDFGSTIISLVKKGLGIAILPDSYIHNENPGIRFIELPLQTELFVNWRTEDHNPILENVLAIILK